FTKETGPVVLERFPGAWARRRRTGLEPVELSAGPVPNRSYAGWARRRRTGLEPVELSAGPVPNRSYNRCAIRLATAPGVLSPIGNGSSAGFFRPRGREARLLRGRFATAGLRVPHAYRAVVDDRGEVSAIRAERHHGHHHLMARQFEDGLT